MSQQVRLHFLQFLTQTKDKRLLDQLCGMTVGCMSLNPALQGLLQAFRIPYTIKIMFITQLQTSDSGTLHNKLMSADVRQIFYTYCSEFGAGTSKLQVIYIQYCVLQPSLHANYIN